MVQARDWAAEVEQRSRFFDQLGPLLLGTLDREAAAEAQAALGGATPEQHVDNMIDQHLQGLATPTLANLAEAVRDLFLLTAGSLQAVRGLYDWEHSDTDGVGAAVQTLMTEITARRKTLAAQQRQAVASAPKAADALAALLAEPVQAAAIGTVTAPPRSAAATLAPLLFDTFQLVINLLEEVRVLRAELTQVKSKLSR